MPDEVKPEVKPPFEVPAQTITKNDTNVPVTLQPVAKGPNAGKSFFMLPTALVSVTDAAKLMGEEFVQKKLNSLLRKGLKDMQEKMGFGKEGFVFDADKFKVEFANYSFISETMGSLKAKITEKLDEMLDNLATGKDNTAVINEIAVLRKTLKRKEGDEDEDDEVVATGVTS